MRPRSHLLSFVGRAAQKSSNCEHKLFFTRNNWRTLLRIEAKVSFAPNGAKAREPIERLLADYTRLLRALGAGAVRAEIGANESEMRALRRLNRRFDGRQASAAASAGAKNAPTIQKSIKISAAYMTRFRGFISERLVRRSHPLAQSAIAEENNVFYRSELKSLHTNKRAINAKRRVFIFYAVCDI